LERLTSYVARAHRQPALLSALSTLDAAEALGFDRLLAAQPGAQRQTTPIRITR
jgi:hypothetical protein